MNSNYLWVFGYDQVPKLINTAGSKREACKIAIRNRVRWANNPDDMSWRDQYRDAIRWFRENDLIYSLDEAEEVEGINNPWEKE